MLCALLLQFAGGGEGRYHMTVMHYAGRINISECWRRDQFLSERWRVPLLLPPALTTWLITRARWLQIAARVFLMRLIKFLARELIPARLVTGRLFFALNLRRTPSQDRPRSLSAPFFAAERGFSRGREMLTTSVPSFDFYVLWKTTST